MCFLPGNLYVFLSQGPRRDTGDWQWVKAYPRAFCRGCPLCVSGQLPPPVEEGLQAYHAMTLWRRLCHCVVPQAGAVPSSHVSSGFLSAFGVPQRSPRWGRSPASRGAVVDTVRGDRRGRFSLGILQFVLAVVLTIVFCLLLCY